MYFRFSLSVLVIVGMGAGVFLRITLTVERVCWGHCPPSCSDGPWVAVLFPFPSSIYSSDALYIDFTYLLLLNILVHCFPCFCKLNYLCLVFKLLVHSKYTFHTFSDFIQFISFNRLVFLIPWDFCIQDHAISLNSESYFFTSLLNDLLFLCLSPIVFSKPNLQLLKKMNRSSKNKDPYFYL